MVTSSVTYELFCLNSTNRLTQLKKQHNEYLEQINQVIAWLDKEKANVYKYTTRTAFVQGTYVPSIVADSSFEKYLNIQYEIYKKAKENLILYKKEYERVQNTNMDKVLYNKILNKINTKIGNKIIDTDYSLYTELFGILTVDFIRSKHKMVNWKVSNENKRKLIEEGKEPYSKKKHEEAIKNNVPYHGVKYQEYHSLFDLKITWDRTQGGKRSLSNIVNYDFRPSSRLIRKIAAVNRELTVNEKIKKYNKKPYNYETN